MKKFVLILCLLVLQLGYAYTQECIYCGDNALFPKSSAIGEYNDNFGINSLTIGTHNFINRDLQLVTLIGEQNKAKYSGLGHSAAVGFNNSIQADYSFAIGRENEVSAVGGIAIGTANSASGLYSFSFGNFSHSEKKYAYTIGTRVRSTAEGAITIGNAPQNHFLTNDILYSLMIGFNSDLPTFFVRYSEDIGTTGRIGIGNVTDPQAKLHVRADSTENASLFLEPSDWSSKHALIKLGTSGHYLKADKIDGMTFKSEKDFLFIWDESDDGNVGIGTSSPSEKLEVAGNISAAQYFGDGSALSGIEGDNLGNHVLTQTLKTSGYWINFDNDPGRGIYINSSGKVGIGTGGPETELEVAGDITATAFHGDGSDLTGTQDNLGNHILQQRLITGNNWINSDHDDNQGIYIGGGGQVGICTNQTGTYKLAVAGSIRATEVQIEHIDNWYDCVFEDNYELTPLKDLEAFVKENKHLPEVPSEAEVMEQGISVGQMNALLLKKVEELTLHLIEQQKQIEELKKVLR